MSNFPKITIESEEFLIQLYDTLDENSKFPSSDYKSEELIDFINQGLIKKENEDFYSFTPLGQDFIKVLKNKKRRTSILKKMTLEDYTLAIYYLSLSNKESEDNVPNIVSMTDLARYLGLSNSSISEYIRIIEKEGFLTVIPRKGVKLTSLGVERVKRLIEKREFLVEFFNNILKIDNDLAEVESHVLEHNLSPIVFERLKLLVTQLEKEKFSLNIPND